MPLKLLSSIILSLFILTVITSDVLAGDILPYSDPVIASLKSNQNPFPDTNVTTEGRAAAELYRRGVISGYPNGTFGGENSVNRAEAAKFLMLARYATEGQAVNLYQRFPDTSLGQWYMPYVIKAADLGIIGGYPDGTFKPADTINTAEFLKMMSLTFNLPQNVSHPYSDVPDGVWYERYTGVANQYRLFPRRSYSYLEPGRLITRNEVAMAIYEVLKEKNGLGAEMGEVGSGGETGGGTDDGNGSSSSSLSCTYDGKTYSDGKTFRSSDSCSDCFCDDGHVLCEAKDCDWAYESEVVTLKVGESIVNGEGERLELYNLFSSTEAFFNRVFKINGKTTSSSADMLRKDYAYVSGKFYFDFISSVFKNYNNPSNSVTFSSHKSCINLYNKCIQGNYNFAGVRYSSDNELHCAKICVEEASPVEYLYDTGGKIKGIFPEQYKDFGVYLTNGFDFCYEKVKNYLGFDIGGSELFIKSVILDKGVSGMAGFNTIYIYSDENKINSEDDNMKLAYESIQQGFCPRTRPFAHELMHIFVMDTIVSATKMDIKWLDEGLASFIAINVLPRSTNENSLRIQCKNDEYTYGSTTQEYIRLSYDNYSSNTGAFYKTGACFWDYIYKEFGETKFKSLLKYIGSTRYKTGTYKIFDEFEKILGKDISDIAYSRFGLRKDLTVEIK